MKTTPREGGDGNFSQLNREKRGRALYSHKGEKGVGKAPSIFSEKERKNNRTTTTEERKARNGKGGSAKRKHTRNGQHENMGGDS